MSSKTPILHFLQMLKLKQYHNEEAVALLRDIVQYIRPKKRLIKTQTIENFVDFAQTLEGDKYLMESFVDLVANIIIDSNITTTLTDTGIVTGATFAQQVRRIINEKIIPPLQEENDLQTYLQQIFNKKWDWQWIGLIPNEMLQPLIHAVNERIKTKANDLQVELQNAAKLLSYRIASLGLEKEILIRANQKEELITPFTEQNIELIHLLQMDNNDVTATEEQLTKIRASLLQCNQSIMQLERNSIETGTSINQTFLLRRIHQNVSRLKFIINLLLKNKPINTASISYFLKDTIQFIQTKNDLRKFASNNLNLLAYRVVDHTKSTGESYITSTRTQYWKMFAAACGGGFIVSLLVLIKFKLGTLNLPVFWESFLYSLNYAIGFIIIQLIGFTLATKQPAMTASAIANELKGRSQKDFVQMSIIISRVSRTQFVSIIGNVFLVMPFILLWLFLYEQVSGVTFLSVTAAEKLLQSNHPLMSLSLLYAAIAGVFLFISGIVSGYVENRIVYAKIPERLQQKTLIKRILPKWMFNGLINLLTHKSGAIFGNATLGFLLGMSTFIGKIFGASFIDIRHVTFAAGNIAMGVFGGGLYNLNFLIACLIGIAGIGLINVFVSFSFAFYVALKARNLHIRDYPKLSKTVFRHFIKTPLEFFLPPKRGVSKFKPKTEKELFTEDLGIQ